MRSVFGHDRAMLESGARARPHSLEAVHFPLQAAQAVSDCSQFAHYRLRLLSTLTYTLQAQYMLMKPPPTVRPFSTIG